MDCTFQVLDSDLCSGTWIPDSNRYWDSGFLELPPGAMPRIVDSISELFSRFHIPQAKIARIPSSGRHHSVIHVLLETWTLFEATTLH